MAEGKRPGITGLGQVAVSVKDMDRAVAFYRDTLGLSFLFQPTPQLAFFDLGSVRLMLDIPEDKRFANMASVLYYRVDDLQASYQALVAKGVLFESEPHLIAKMPDHELWMAFLPDSEGNMLALMSEVRG